MNQPLGDTSAFALSRIYGQGWNAAKKLIADGNANAAAEMADRNPYRAAEESSRWAEGFMAALDSRVASAPVRGRRR